MSGLSVTGTGISTVMPQAGGTYSNGLTAAVGLPMISDPGFPNPVSGLTLRGAGFTLGARGQGATTIFSFLADGALPSGATLTRASTGWYFNSSLALAAALTDVARWNYSPTLGTLQGLLNEPAATNSLRNASAIGAVAGTPGTQPTNWSLTTTANNVTRQIFASSTEDGLAYAQVKYNGTPSASGSLAVSFDLATQVAALVGQTWIGSSYLEIVLGSLTNLNTIRFVMAERNAGGTQLASQSYTVVPTTAALRTQRFDCLRTLNQATTAFVQFSFGAAYTINLPVDVTLRFGLPQLVQTPGAASPIVTTTVAVTRAADILTLILANGTYTIYITRLSGLTIVSGVVVSGGAYIVPTDLSPLRGVTAIQTA